jgi:hypothetical protein
MGKIGDWISAPAGGGAQQLSATWVTEASQWSAWLNGRQPSADTGIATEWSSGSYADQNFNVKSAMLSASSGQGGNPYLYKFSIDPTTLLEDIDSRYNDLINYLQDDVDPDAALMQAIDDVLDKFDDKLFSSGAIDAMVKANRESSDVALAQDVSRLSAALMDQRAIFNTQYESAIAVLEIQRNLELRNFEYRLRLANNDQRNQMAISLAQQVVALQLAEYNAKRDAFAAAMDRARFNLVARNDRLTMDLQFETRARLWDLELFPYGMSVISGIRGAQLQPRGQTNGERLLANLGGAISGGINMGTSMGNAGAGAATAGGQFLLQTLLTS